ncbi:unnamed protein product [Lactuca virosa]|uniref:Uncharacterized protein n=1 Tax=Lactuca virosa TaxID=75947 RepID=A0AAU9M3W9_9ASTR|nr:unnamed protein product [Lactuca virosa]
MKGFRASSDSIMMSYYFSLDKMLMLMFMLYNNTNKSCSRRCCKKIGSSLSSSGGGYAFDPAEVRHTFRATGERFACVVVSEYVANSFTHLLHEISGFRVVLDQELGLILKLRDMMIGWIHEGFQSFFRQLNDELLLLSGQNVNVNVNVNVVQQHQQELQQEMLQGDKVPVGVVLVISQPSVFIEREANARKIGSSLSSSGGGYAFDPAEVRHTFIATGESSFVSANVQVITCHPFPVDSSPVHQVANQ